MFPYPVGLGQANETLPEVVSSAFLLSGRYAKAGQSLSTW